VRTAECKGCRALMIWTTTDKGKKLPLNAEPDPKGTYTIDVTYHGGASPTYHAVFVGLMNSEEFKGKRYVPHWTTCPERAQFGKKRPA